MCNSLGHSLSHHTQKTKRSKEMLSGASKTSPNQSNPLIQHQITLCYLNLWKCWYLKLISCLGSYQNGSHPYLTMAEQKLIATADQKLIATADQSVTKLSHKWPPLPKSFPSLPCNPQELIPSAETQHRGGGITESSRYWQSSAGNQEA